ncbi:hypothetical protein [Roseibium sp.]|uniref:glycosyltransferase n=1 Tax=Roseibium sp. TaxID=1936156 RepID=UPI00329737EA
MEIISTSDLMGKDWSFLSSHSADPAWSWSTHSGLPRNGLERAVKRPHLGRYRAAWTAVQQARKAPNALLVSHLPMMGGATNVLRRKFCPDVPQIGFSFNFTQLPTGLRRRYLTGALQGISEFVVYSRFELDLYPNYFGMDPARFRFLPWAMDPPQPGPVNPTGLTGPYLCAIGGEGRDYRLLAQVMRDLPQIPMVVIARPYSIDGIDFPDNVQVFTNLPLAQTWRIAQDSQGLVIPLLSSDTACGHITIVGAQLLGIPLLVTQSRGVSDYVIDNETAQLVTAGNAEELRRAVVAMFEDQPACQARAAAGLVKAQTENSLTTWLAYFQDCQKRLGL